MTDEPRKPLLVRVIEEIGDPERTLEDEWIAFINGTDYANLPVELVRPVKTAFYYGAEVMMQRMMTLVTKSHVEADVFVSAERQRRGV